MKSAIALLLLSGCALWTDADRAPPARTDPPAPVQERVVIAATRGGDGGVGGIVSIRSAEPATLDGLLSVEGGPAGWAGLFDAAPPAEDGLPGPAGSIEVLEDAGYLFNPASVPTGSLVSVGVAGQADMLPEGSDPHIAVERLEVGDGATLMLSRYPLIIARELIVHEGARLILRDTGSIAVATAETALDARSLSGASATIFAERITIDGIVDASGTDGGPSLDGGFGGHLIVRTEELHLGPEASIRADGGLGGDGENESIVK